MTKANCVLEKNDSTTPDFETRPRWYTFLLRRLLHTYSILVHCIRCMRLGGYIVINGGVVTRNRQSINQSISRLLLGAWLFFMCSAPDCFLFSTSCRPEAHFANGIGYSYIMEPGCFLFYFFLPTGAPAIGTGTVI